MHAELLNAARKRACRTQPQSRPKICCFACPSARVEKQSPYVRKHDVEKSHVRRLQRAGRGKGPEIAGRPLASEMRGPQLIRANGSAYFLPVGEGCWELVVLVQYGAFASGVKEGDSSR